MAKARPSKIRTKAIQTMRAKGTLMTLICLSSTRNKHRLSM